MTNNTRELDPNTIFVRNINYQTKAEALADTFAKYGEIKRAKMLTERLFGQTFSRGSALITFNSPDAVTAVLADSDITLDNRTLQVRQASKKYIRRRDTIFVSGIPAGTTVDQLKEAFNGYNPVEAIIGRENAGNRYGYAFVKLASHQDQVRALSEKSEVPVNGEQSRISTSLKEF